MKKELDFKKLDSSKSKAVETETAVRQIHSEKQDKEPTKRITIDLPKSTYLKVKMKAIKGDITIKSYFLSLLENDFVDEK